MAYQAKGVVKDSAFYSRIGKLGGQRTRARQLAKNPNYYHDIGMMGYEAATEKHGKKHMRAGGRIGGVRSAELRKARKEANAK